MAKKSATVKVQEPLTDPEEQEMVKALEELRKELEPEDGTQKFPKESGSKVKTQRQKISPTEEDSKGDEFQAVSDEVVTVKDLADEFNLTPITVRRKLRDSAISKPGGRWEWPKNHPDLAKIRELLS